MATVYLARDLKHGREVAVKVLRPDLTATVGSERFLREIDIAAHLTHPNILGLFDSGQAGDFLFYVMPFVAGGSLRERLRKNKVLIVDEAIGILREVAEALFYAHRKGVIHRDIKPENILFSEGHAIVTDFGIAKAIITAGGENLTRSGFPLGTPGYMSPEQAAGLKKLDERTDVYGVGCVFYEMLVGETPGLWLTEEVVRLGRFMDAEPDHRERLDQLPGRLEQAMVRSLAMRREDRYKTPLEFLSAVRKGALGSNRLTDGEVDNIIVRASELQAEYPTEDGRLTIGVLEEVMAEVGVAPERLREAAEEVGGDIISGGGYATGEVKEIVERAVELEGAISEEGWALSLGGMERVGAEVGIEPKFVRDAANELATSPAKMPVREGGPPWILGRSPFITIERTIPREIEASETASLVEEIRSKLGIFGEISATGTSLTWTAATIGRPERNIVVTISAEAGTTTVLLREDITDFSRQMAGGFVGLMSGGLLGFGFAFGLGGPDFAPLVVTGFAIAGAYLFARSDFTNMATRNEQELNELADSLVELIEKEDPPALMR